MSLDEEEIEDMIAACREAAEHEPRRFTTWELGFLESLEDRNVDHHLTEDQIAKLAQIYEERCCG